MRNEIDPLTGKLLGPAEIESANYDLLVDDINGSGVRMMGAQGEGGTAALEDCEADLSVCDAALIASEATVTDQAATIATQAAALDYADYLIGDYYRFAGQYEETGNNCCSGTVWPYDVYVRIVNSSGTTYTVEKGRSLDAAFNCGVPCLPVSVTIGLSKVGGGSAPSLSWPAPSSGNFKGSLQTIGLSSGATYNVYGVIPAADGAPCDVVNGCIVGQIVVP